MEEDRKTERGKLKIPFTTGGCYRVGARCILVCFYFSLFIVFFPGFLPKSVISNTC